MVLRTSVTIFFIIAKILLQIYSSVVKKREIIHGAGDWWN